MRKIAAIAMIAVIASAVVTIGYAETIIDPLDTGDVIINAPADNGAVVFTLDEDNSIDKCLVTLDKSINSGTGAFLECKLVSTTGSVVASGIRDISTTGYTANTEVDVNITSPPDPSAINGVKLVVFGPKVAPGGPTNGTARIAVNFDIGLDPNDSSTFNKITACLIEFDDDLLDSTEVKCILTDVNAAAIASGTVTVSATNAFVEITVPVDPDPDVQDVDDVQVIVTPPAVGEECDGLQATIVGTPGDDSLTGTPGNDVMVGLGGNDTINGNDGDDVICGGDGDDNLHGNKGADRIFGDGGDDDIHGNNGADTIFGGSGEDDIDGDNGADTIFGGAGADDLEGGNGEDVINGGGGNDDIDGDGNNDILNGDAGNDEIEGGPGNDTADGGDGTDKCKAETEINCES